MVVILIGHLHGHRFFKPRMNHSSFLIICCIFLNFALIFQPSEGSTYESPTLSTISPQNVSQTATNSNPCALGVCINGTCTNTLNGYKCTCNPGFTGNNCEYFSACTNHKCENGAICTEIPKSTSYNCECVAGFSGKYCEIHLVQSKIGCDKDKDYCQNNGKCESSSKCVCLPGFTGRRCESKIDHCDPNPCQNNGHCSDNGLAYSCDCNNTGFSGVNCTENIDECLQFPCLNNGKCIDYNGGYTCHCRSEFSGQNCQYNAANCTATKCKNNGKCVDNDYGSLCQCIEEYTGHQCEIHVDHCNTESCYKDPSCYNGYCLHKDPCLKTPCSNGGTCLTSAHSPGFSCVCPPGYTGQLCESNGCRAKGIPCEHGYCFHVNHTFSCFCERGYSGERCERNFNECLSNPCKNNATCHDGIDQFYCDCPAGFTGIDCGIDIDECESNPCQGHSTCIDLVNAFKCDCEMGLTGVTCEINIDDCSPNPCENNGLCIDRLSAYTCDCNATGFYGANCEHNIDDCNPNPCKNGATCLDEIKNYTCQCHSAYFGRQCEIDKDDCVSVPCKFGSTCLQRSNVSLYHFNNDDFMLPDIFQNEFSYENASGYECICVNGTTGDNCEVDIDECETVQCIGGKCEDKLGYYVCNCDEGYEGDKCEIEIDECERYKPCLNRAKCYDRIANYYCDCVPGFGGKNCSIELIGCLENKCLNNGTCKPHLINETIHTFNCSCPLGFHGHTCEKITTMSFSGRSYVQVNTSKEEGYEIQFRFRTTIDNALLAFGQGQTYYMLKLSGGKLNLHSSLLNKWNGVFIGGGLNNSHWHRIFVAINSSHLVLAANDEQTIYPITLNENMNTSHTSFSTTYLGGTIDKLRSVANSPSFFVGCLENTIVNGQWVLPTEENYSQNSNNSLQIFNNVEIGCPRKVQCDPNPCKSGGTCVDNWRHFSCLCQRPYLGNTCQYNYTAATFGYEDIKQSSVTVQVSELARKITKTYVHVSMFIRTRQNDGKIFYLGSNLNKNQTDESERSYIAAMLEAGELVLKIRFKSAPTSYHVSGVKLDDGSYHFIEVIRVSQPQVQVQIKLNGTEYFKNSADDSLNIQVMYLGDWPDFERFYRKSDDKVSDSNESQIDVPLSESFKGIIQDVQISNGSQRMVVEFFPLNLDEIPMSFGQVAFDKNRVLKGVLSDNSCQKNLCQNNSTCTVTWNDFSCSCKIGFKGRFCEQIEYCQLNKCPTNSVCLSVNKYYECLSNLTFNGLSYQPVTYRFKNRLDDDIDFRSIRIAARTKTEGYLLSLHHGSSYLSLKCNNLSQILVESNFDGSHNRELLNDSNVEAGNWFSLFLFFDDNDKDVLKIKYNFNEAAKESSVVRLAVNVANFSKMITEGDIILGGNRNFTNYNYVYNSNSTEMMVNTTVVTSNDNYFGTFKGCLGLIKFDNISLWYTRPDNLTYFDYYFESQSSIEDDRIGCVLCHKDQCKNNGDCMNIHESYDCNCTRGYSGIDCSINEDNCVSHKCQQNATCLDDLDSYVCQCQNNTEGTYCERINYCLSYPCKNGAPCKNTPTGYDCQCGYGYSGQNCEIPSTNCSAFLCQGDNCKNQINCTLLCEYYCDYNINCDKEKDECECSKNATTCSKPPLDSLNDSGFDIRLVVIPLLFIVGLVVIISLGFFITVARQKRATRGTYSPSAQEYSNPRVELAHVLKHPPEERLI